MSQKDIYSIGSALIAWAKSKGMNPFTDFAVVTRTASRPMHITLLLREQFNEARVPNVDMIAWKDTHPGIVTGIQNQTWNGKPSPQVRGGWTDFTCPVKINGVWE